MVEDNLRQKFFEKKLLPKIEDFGWNYACRTAKNARLFEEGEQFRFQDICPEKGDITEIEAVEFTDKRDIVVRAVVYWGKAYKKPIYLITNALTGGEALKWYEERFKIETLFSDFKGRGST